MANQPIRILLVDDDKEDFLIVRNFLAGLKNRNCCAEYELVWESRYESALSQAANYQFDVYLIDYLLGEQTGLDLLEAFKKQGANVPIILLTGTNDEWLDMAALKAGAADYLIKGEFNAAMLDRAIRYAVNGHQMMAALRHAESCAREAYGELEKRTLAQIGLNQKLEVELKERKRLEGQLIQSQKMESIGQLAAGVAHEINNPIAFVKCNVGMLSRYADTFNTVLTRYAELESELDEEKAAELRQLREKHNLSFLMEDLRALLSESTEGIQRVEEIVQGLKCFARADEVDARDTDLNDCLEKTLKVIWNQMKYRANVHKNFTELPLVPCHQTQISQVFMNLLINAAQAMPENTMGDIVINTAFVNDEVVVTISDTGGGIPQDKLSRIFDPFFTTKPVGQGTGLGLSVSYGIVEKHGGRITVESEVGVGTTFTVTLPAPVATPAHVQEELKEAA